MYYVVVWYDGNNHKSYYIWCSSWQGWWLECDLSGWLWWLHLRCSVVRAGARVTGVGRQTQFRDIAASSVTTTVMAAYTSQKSFPYLKAQFVNKRESRFWFLLKFFRQLLIIFNCAIHFVSSYNTRKFYIEISNFLHIDTCNESHKSRYIRANMENQ